MTNKSTRNCLKLGVVGVSGRMGQMLVAIIDADESVELSGASEFTGHEWVGTSLMRHFAQLESNLYVCDNPAEAFAQVDAIIDFSSPAATVLNAEFAASAQKVHVIGTTGLSKEDLVAIRRCAESTVIVRAGNMSLGVNLLVGLTETVARALGPEFDIEIVEHHHRHKVDAPSGTALMLGDAAARGRRVEPDDTFDRGRDGMTAPRKSGAIGFSAIRGGDVVGEHDVIFAGRGERLMLRHIASDRGIFARGAIEAARWGVSQSCGEYDMNDVLGINQPPR